MELEYPSCNTLEISLLGTGGGYGESLVIHLPDDNWIIVDSCVDPNTKEILPIEYLKKLGVDYSKIKLIVATHWHDDHIRGISDILELATDAKFSVAGCTDLDKFLILIGVDSSKDKFTSSTQEFYKCIEIIKNRNSTIYQSIADRTLYSDKDISVLSLSPSDYSNQLFNQELVYLIDNYTVAHRKIVSKSPNSRSIVLLIKAGNHRAILGADLEVEADNRLGWLAILDSTVIDRAVKMFKIPHHGSENGYDEAVWDKLIEKEPVLGLTPWNRNRKLPSIEMLKVFCDKSPNVFMTSRIVSDSPKKRNKIAENIIRQLQLDKKLTELKFNFGHVKFTIDKDSSEDWKVECFGAAFNVNSTIKEE